MLINNKFRACIISLVLLLNIFSFSFLNINQVKAEDNLDEVEDLLNYINLLKQFISFDEPISPHPFKHVAIWQSNETIKIIGDITFDIYFSSTLTTQIDRSKFHDKINITVHHQDNFGNIKQIENANIELTLDPDVFENRVQSLSVKLENINQTIEEFEYLIFNIEIIQSKKEVNNIVKYRFEKYMKSNLIKLAEYLKNRDEPEYQELGILIEDGLEFLTKNLSIGGEEFGHLVNVLFSSAFYYGSDLYSSSVRFSTDEDENKTLYFQHMSDFEYYNEINEITGHIRIINEIKPNGTIDYAWPPIALNEEIDLNATEDSEFIIWLGIWFLYYLSQTPEISENVVTYYLHSDNKMNEIAPNGTETIKDPLNSKLKWTGSSFGRNKIITNVSAELYIHFPRVLGSSNILLNATLKAGNNTITSEVKKVDKTNVTELLRGGPDDPTIFYFNNFSGNKEIWYNENLTLEVFVSSKPLLNLIRPVKIFYNSEIYPSSVSYTLEETDNIKIVEGINNKLIYAGGIAEYEINVTSKYSDTLNINVETNDFIGDWAEFEYPKSIEIEPDSTETINLIVKSTAEDDSAYGSAGGVDNDEIKFTIEVSGYTGYDNNQSKVSVSEDADGIYNFEIFLLEESIEVKHGESGTYQLIIRNLNSGFIKDYYNIEVTSEHDYIYINDYILGEDDEDLGIYDESDVEPVEALYNITVNVPWYSDKTLDTLYIKVTSGHSFDRNKPYALNITGTTKIITPNIFETIYLMFESIGHHIGITSRYAGWIMIGAIFFVIIILILFILLISRRKFVDLICLNRIKEISPEESAIYEITVKNPYKRTMTYIIYTNTSSETKRWEITLDKSQVDLEPGQTQNISLKITPTDYIRKDDWIEVKAVAKATEKNKLYEISTVTSIKNSEVKLEIVSVFHWPKIFKKGDRVETTFKVMNRGNVSAHNVSIRFLVNDEEKNKVEGINIPRGGYADIEIPWIAVKGKNDVYIIVK